MEVIKIGSNSIHDKTFQVERPHGYPFYLFLLIKSPALFVIDGKEILAESNSAIIYDKHCPHYYSSYHRTYINDWIHFEEENGTDYFNSHQLPLNTLFKIYDDTFISEMIRLMSMEYYSINANKTLTMGLLLHTMFSKLSEVASHQEIKKESLFHYEALVSLRKEIYHSPKTLWTVELMANKLNLSSAYLQKIYRETFGISCIADTIACRIGYSKDLLSKTQMPVKEVAEECGYQNEVHFMRQFKKIVGVTPSEYRRHSFSYLIKE